MKKLLTVLAASVGIAAFADTAPLSATSFEGYKDDFSIEKDDAGNVVSEGRTWAGTKDADGDTNVITAYGEATPPANRPDYYKDATPQEAFLKVDSTAGLARYVNADGDPQGLDSNVYFDMDVQFTVSDDVQKAAEGDKLLVWLYAPDTDNATTNLVVTAATIGAERVPTTVNFVVAADGVNVQADTWYRLTVVSTTKEVEEAAVPHFQVYIDGKQAIPTGTMASDGAITALSEHDGLFGSLVQYDSGDTTTTTLTSVTFKGTGAVDDLVVTTATPGFITEPTETMYFQVGEDEFKTFAEALEAGTTITMLANYDVANEDDSVEISADVTLNLGGFELSSTVADDNTVSVLEGYTFSLVGAGSVTASGSGNSVYVEGTLVIGNGDGVPTIASVQLGTSGTVKYYGTTGTRPAVYDDNGDAITGTWEAEAGETGYYVFTAGGDEPSSDTYDIPGDASLSADGTITVPTGTAKIKLGDDDVTAGFTIEGTTATLKTPVIEANGVADDDNEEEALVVTDTQVKIGVKAVQGLYYGVGTSTDVTKVARPVTLIKFTGDNRAEIFTKAKTENADGEFYKVYVDIKE